MVIKQALVNISIQRLEKLKQETILRYTDEIEYDQDLSLYDVMMSHFVNGDLDDVFITDVTDGMDKKEANALFELAREFLGLCFFKGDSDYWIDSLENTPIADYNLIAYSILNSYDYLLNLAKIGGRDSLELLISLRAFDDIRDLAIVNYLKNTFVNDDVLNTIILDMSKQNSKYGIFTEEQKGILLSYPEGSLYSYGNNSIMITNPLVLGCQIYNKFNKDFSIDTLDVSNVDDVVLTLSNFFRNENIDFQQEVLTLVDKYRDYVRKNNIVLVSSEKDVVITQNDSNILEAWRLGDEMLGSTYDTPYVGGAK